MTKSNKPGSPAQIYGPEINGKREIVPMSPAQISDEKAVQSAYPNAMWIQEAGAVFATKNGLGQWVKPIGYGSYRDAWADARSRLEPVEAPKERCTCIETSDGINFALRAKDTMCGLQAVGKGIWHGYKLSTPASCCAKHLEELSRYDKVQPFRPWFEIVEPVEAVSTTPKTTKQFMVDTYGPRNQYSNGDQYLTWMGVAELARLYFTKPKVSTPLPQQVDFDELWAKYGVREGKFNSLPMSYVALQGIVEVFWNAARKEIYAK